MSNIYNGTAVNFGITGLTFAYSSLTGFFLPQDLDFSMERDLDAVRDGTGAIVQKTWYNPFQKATLSFVVKGTGLAAAINNTVVPDKGVFVNISASTDFTQMVESTWEVVGAKLKASNTKAKMITLDLEYNANITAASSA